MTINIWIANVHKFKMETLYDKLRWKRTTSRLILKRTKKYNCIDP